MGNFFAGLFGTGNKVQYTKTKNYELPNAEEKKNQNNNKYGKSATKTFSPNELARFHTLVDKKKQNNAVKQAQNNSRKRKEYNNESLPPPSNLSALQREQSIQSGQQGNRKTLKNKN